jgi:hypothetical protein
MQDRYKNLERLIFFLCKTFISRKLFILLRDNIKLEEDAQAKHEV